jgi:hypothetical protein
MSAGYAREPCKTQYEYPDEDAPILDPRCGRRNQNSHREMLARLGPWPEGLPKPDAWEGACPNDREAPEVTILHPGPDSDVAPRFSLKAVATDACAGPAQARVTVPSRGLTSELGGEGPFVWDFELEPGVVEILITVRDGNGNEGRASTKVRVGGVGRFDDPEPPLRGMDTIESRAHLSVGPSCRLGGPGARGAGGGLLPFVLAVIAGGWRRRAARRREGAPRFLLRSPAP